jgi:hypothetical protein
MGDYIYIPLWIFHIPSYSIIFHNYILNIMDTHSSYPLLISMVTWSGLCWRRSSGLSGLSVGVTSAAVAVAVKARVRRRATKGAAREELGHLQTIIWNVYIYIICIIYIYIHICTIMKYYEHVYIYTNMHKHIHTYIYTYTYTYTYHVHGWMHEQKCATISGDFIQPPQKNNKKDKISWGQEMRSSSPPPTRARPLKLPRPFAYFTIVQLNV